MSITRLSGGLTPGDGEDPRTFPAIFNEFADEFEDKNLPAFSAVAPTDGQVPVFDAVEGVFVPGEGGAGSLEDLTDTDISSPVSGEALVYDGSDWVNADLQTNSDLFLQNDVTVTVGATGDYSTLQEAFDDLAPLNPGPHLIEVKIQSGTTINAGLELVGGDFRHFTITSEDATVPLGSGIGIQTDFVHLVACFGPTIEVFFDGTNHPWRGFALEAKSSIVIAPDCGIDNVGRIGIDLLNSDATIRDAIITNTRDFDNVRANAGSTIDALRGHFTGANRNGVFSGSVSRVDARNSEARKTPGVDDPQDLRVATGGTLGARGATGGTSVTVNTVTSDGIIFQ